MFEEAQDALNAQIEAIKASYAPRLKALQDEGQQLRDETERPSDVGVILGVDFKVDWKDEELIFDVPTITMRDQRLSLHLPEVEMVRQHIAFDTPSVRMVNKKVGQYPEIHGFKVVWKDIIISVPETFMQRQDIYFDLPSISMRPHEFVIGIPEFSMNRIRWVIGLPQFTVVNVKASITEMKDRGDALKTKGESLAREMKADVEHAVALFSQQVASGAESTRDGIAAGFDAALSRIDAAIKELVARGCDPIKVPTANGDINLRKLYAEVTAQRAAAIDAFDQSAAGAALPNITEAA